MSFASLLLDSFPFEPTNGQKILAGRLEQFLSEQDPSALFVLKGYAGTGKTSFISAMVRILPAVKKKAILLAPTGRAAKVLSGYSGQHAWTIHKRIYFQRLGRDGSISLVLQKNLYRNAIFIVDEASMIAAATESREVVFSARNLLDDLLEYVTAGEACRLVLIGDNAQLPPVGMIVSPALDLEYLKSRYGRKIHHFELTEVMRQAMESGILHNATRLRDFMGISPVPAPLFDLSEYRDVERINGNDLEDRLNVAYSSGDPGETVVICRSNKRANMYNKAIRERILFLENEIASGDFLMVARNNYFWLDPESGPGFIANGDIIEILRIQNTEEIYGFRFADVTIRMIDYPDEPTLDLKILLDTLMADAPALPDAEQKQLFSSVMEDYNDVPQRSVRLEKVRTNPYYNALQVKFAYSLTCHKTQGGQWLNVFIDQGYIKNVELDTGHLRWLYTAFTRAVKKVHLINFSENLF